MQAETNPRASTRPQSEPRWSLWLLASLMLGAAALVVWCDAATALGFLAVAGPVVMLAMWWREQRLLQRLAAGTEAMAALDMPLLLLDKQDRVRWASAAFAAQYPGLGRVEVGTPYATLVQRALDTGAVSIAPEERDNWMRQRIEAHAGNGDVRLQTMRDGRVLQVVERRTPQGGWTAVAMDVTELTQTRDALRQARDEARAAQGLLEDALDAMPAGFEIWDREDRLLRCNRRLLDLYPGTADLLRPGVTFEEVARRTLDLQMIPAARGREGEWLAERVAQRGRHGRPMLVDYGGRWIQIDERRTRNGQLVCVRQDLTELVEARRALTQAQSKAERQQRLLLRAVDALPVALEIYDEHDCLLMVNRIYRGWNPSVDYDPLIGSTFAQLLRVSQKLGLLPKEAQGDPEAWIAQRLAQRGQRSEPWLQHTASGRELLVQETRTPEGCLVITRQDLSSLRDKERALEEARAQLEALVQTAGAAIVTLDARGHLRSMNLAAQALWGDPGSSLIGKPSRYLLHPDAQPEAVAAFEQHRAGGDGGLVGRRREFIGQHLSGRALILQAAISEVCSSGAPPIYVAVVIDVTEQRRAEAQLREANERLEHLSSTDSLTGLANRRALMQHLQLLWGQGLRDQVRVAVLLLDVDFFKRYNDHHGHQAGDEALRVVAEELQRVARRAGDLAARYGGEEFVLLLDHCDVDGAMARAHEMRERLMARALPHGDAPLGRVSVSIGVCSLLPTRELKPEELFSRADAALYQAKAAGRDRVQPALTPADD